MRHGGVGQARADLNRPPRLIGVEVAHFVGGRMGSPNVLPAYARGQGYPRRDAPGILEEGGMPLLAPMIGVVAGYYASAGRATLQKRLQVRKADNTVLAGRRRIVEMGKNLFNA